MHTTPSSTSPIGAWVDAAFFGSALMFVFLVCLWPLA